MKSRVRSNSFKTSKSRPSFYTYLKPGALSKIRYSKIAGKSKEIDAQTLIALCQLKSTSESALSQTNPITDNSIEGFPKFSSRFQKNYPRCLQRKKLIAVCERCRKNESVSCLINVQIQVGQGIASCVIKLVSGREAQRGATLSALKLEFPAVFCLHYPPMLIKDS